MAAGNTCDGVGVVNPGIYETGNEEAEEASSKSAKMADGERSRLNRQPKTRHQFSCGCSKHKQRQASEELRPLSLMLTLTDAGSPAVGGSSLWRRLILQL